MNASRQLSFTVNPGAQPVSGQFLPELVANAKAKATVGHPDWLSLRTLLDSKLPTIVSTGSYEGSSMDWALEFSIGYVCCKATGDDARADHYARKALSLGLSAIRDYQKGGEVTRQYYGLADGVTKTYTLPDVPMAAFNAYTYASVVKPVVRRTVAYDLIDSYVWVIFVADNADGSSPYIKGVDWTVNGDNPNNYLVWIPGGRQPAAGATYYVQWATNLFAVKQATTLSGNMFTFVTTPAKDTAIFVEYVRADYSQTSAGDGGLNSMIMDSGGYAARYLGKDVAAVICLCGDHPAVQAYIPEMRRMLVKWFDWLVANGYNRGSIHSNYGVGEYMQHCFTAVALDGTPDGDRVKQFVTDFRTNRVIPQMRGPAPSLVGGFPFEGWNYGAFSTWNLILAGECLRQAGYIPDDAAEKAFASDVCEHLAETSPYPGISIGLGDFFSFPPPMPETKYQASYSAWADDPARGGYLGDAVPSTGWINLSLPPRPPKVQPTKLMTFAAGSGLLTARNGFAADSVVATTLTGNLGFCDHQTYAAGCIELWRGKDCLLVTERTIHGGNIQNLSQNSQHANVLIADDGYVSGGPAPQLQDYRYNQASAYGTPGVVNLAREETADYIRTADSLAASYSKKAAPGQGGSLSQWVRHFLFLKQAAALVVCDFYTLKNQYCSAWPRWFPGVGPNAVQSGDQWTVDRGLSRLAMQFFSTDPLTVTQTIMGVSGKSVPQLDIKSGLLTGSIISVHQTGPAGANLIPAVLNQDGSVSVAGHTISFKIDGSATVI